LKHLKRLEGRANGSEPDVREDNSRVGRVLLNILGLTRVGSASTTGSTELGGVGGVGRVEPEHVDGVVVPKRHNEDVAASKRGSHAIQATERLELVVVAESSFLRSAEGVSDRVASHTLNGGVAVGEGLAVLYVEALDLRQGAAGADELSHDGHLLLGVEGRTRAVEVGHTHAVALLSVSVIALHGWYLGVLTLKSHPSLSHTPV
jgi:hypothetical protein